MTVGRKMMKHLCTILSIGYYSEGDSYKVAIDLVFEDRKNVRQINKESNSWVKLLFCSQLSYHFSCQAELAFILLACDLC